MRGGFSPKEGGVTMVQITGVLQGSSAERAGIRAGDVLVSINGNDIVDVLDYRFYLAEAKVTFALLRNGAPFSVTLKKEVYDDVGLDFETPLMDKKQCCANRCISRTRLSASSRRDIVWPSGYSAGIIFPLL